MDFECAQLMANNCVSEINNLRAIKPIGFITLDDFITPIKKYDISGNPMFDDANPRRIPWIDIIGFAVSIATLTCGIYALM